MAAVFSLALALAVSHTLAFRPRAHPYTHRKKRTCPSLFFARRTDVGTPHVATLSPATTPAQAQHQQHQAQQNPPAAETGGARSKKIHNERLFLPHPPTNKFLPLPIPHKNPPRLLTTVQLWGARGASCVRPPLLFYHADERYRDPPSRCVLKGSYETNNQTPSLTTRGAATLRLLLWRSQAVVRV